MLLPKEKPYFNQLHSYYIEMDKFINHMQNEIGSGCIYCQSTPKKSREIMIYFNKFEIVQLIVQDERQPVQLSTSLDSLVSVFRKYQFLVSVFTLELNAVYFWGKMPAYEYYGRGINMDDNTFTDVIRRIERKKLSGFLDIDIPEQSGALLFHDQGELKGGSYSWGSGGLSPWDQDFDRLLTIIGKKGAVLDIGTFVLEEQKYTLTIDKSEVQSQATVG